jgi:hypothetical protein
MANIKITDLTAYAAPRTTDVIPIVDVTTDTTKKVAVGEVVGKITGDVDVATDGTSSIAAGAIVNADVNASAAIAGTKIAPNFGSQTIETTGVINAGSGTAAAPSVSVGTTDNGMYSPGADQVALSTNGTERVLINQDGTATFNATVAPGDNYKNIDGQRAVMNSGRSSTLAVNHIIFQNPNGDVGFIDTTGTTTRYITSSDYRLKENVVPVTDGITRLQQLKPSRFNFIADPDTVVDGFLAHQVQTVVPEATTGEKDAVDDDGNPVYQGIDQSKLVPLLTAALQEAVAKIESLEARLSAAGI